jgi:hypothetical protein
MTDWWSNIEREIDRLGEHAPDPWADEARPVRLTPEQVAFLEQVDGVAETFVRDDEWDDDQSGDTTSEPDG